MTDQQSIDWALERANFPTCQDYVYFMSASNAPLSKAVYQAQRAILDQLHIGAHTSWSEVITKAGELRQDLGELFGGTAADWGFGANSSHNMNLLALGLKDKLGALEVVSFAAEFPSSTIAWQYHGHHLRKIAHDEKSAITLARVKEALEPQTKVVVLSHVQYSTGYRSDLKAIGSFLKERGIYFIVNATQSLGIYPLNVEEMHISALTCSGHKWLGTGYGAALLYTSAQLRQVLHWPMAGTLSFIDPDFKGDLKTPRPGTAFIELGAMPFMQILGVHAAIEEIRRLSLERIQARVLTLSALLVDRLKEAGFKLGHPRDEWDQSHQSNLIYVEVARPDEVAAFLLERKVLVTNRHGLLRVAVHYFNNEADIEKLVRSLRDATS